MNDMHSTILETYFWTFVDAGIAPERTPLFSGFYNNKSIQEIITTQFSISPEDAEAALEAARQEVVL